MRQSLKNRAEKLIDQHKHPPELKFVVDDRKRAKKLDKRGYTVVSIRVLPKGYRGPDLKNYITGEIDE